MVVCSVLVSTVDDTTHRYTSKQLPHQREPARHVAARCGLPASQAWPLVCRRSAQRSLSPAAALLQKQHPMVDALVVCSKCSNRQLRCAADCRDVLMAVQRCM